LSSSLNSITVENFTQGVSRWLKRPTTVPPLCDRYVMNIAAQHYLVHQINFFVEADGNYVGGHDVTHSLI
jgi:hypothetical protein